MKALTILWLGGSAALVGYLLTRYAILQSQLTRARKLLVAHAHTEALIEDDCRAITRRNEDAYRRLYRDILADSAPVQRVTPCVFQTGLPRGSVIGCEVRAHNVVEAAEIVSQSPVFKSRAA
jgi:hypothetical protein